MIICLTLKVFNKQNKPKIKICKQKVKIQWESNNK